MLEHVIQFSANNQAELLERVFKTVRHRGFSVVDSKISLDADTNLFHVELCVAGARPVEYLTKQLQKLWDVKALEVK